MRQAASRLGEFDWLFIVGLVTLLALVVYVTLHFSWEGMATFIFGVIATKCAAKIAGLS